MKLKNILFKIICLLIVAFSSFITANADDNKIVYTHHINDEMKIALSFDDGPHYKYTEEILDILKEYNIKGTFFVIGENAKKYPELIRREIKEGHEIGNHTYCHPKMKKICKNNLTFEIKSTENILFEIAEYTPKLFRPPEGLCSIEVVEVAQSLNYNVILWNIDTMDWAHNSTKKASSNILSNIKSGDIILFHDFVTKPSPTPQTLRTIIPELKKMGYVFTTVSELIES